MAPRFLYFDLGNVLLFFDHDRACRQMAEVAGISDAQVRSLLFDTGLQRRYELGEISTREFYDEFCQRTGTRPDFQTLCVAGSEMFEINVGVKAIIGQLRRAGHRLGLLSNTCAMHWDYYASGRYALIPEAFEVLALSYRLGAMKPDPAIFSRAAELAKVAPEEIFFTDDLPQHVEAARQSGFDAVQYTSVPALVDALRTRGVQFNF